MISAHVMARELMRRGYHVQAVETTADGFLVTVEFMPGRSPNWMKGVVVKGGPNAPDAADVELGSWQQKILGDIADGTPSPIVRKMIAEHGYRAVLDAMRPVCAA